MPLQAVKYRADYANASEEFEEQERQKRAEAYAARQEKMRLEYEKKLMGIQEALKQKKVDDYKHSYYRDAREWRIRNQETEDV